MSGWKVFLTVVLVLFLLGLVRVGGSAEYCGEGLTARGRLGAFWIPVYPIWKKGRKKPAKPKKKEKKREKEEQKPGTKSGGSMALVQRMLPLVGKAAGELRRKIRIDKLYLDLTVGGGSDAAGAAMMFGYSNMAFGMIWPIFEQNFEVKDHRFRTAVDFDALSSVIYLNVTFSARIGQLVSFALRFGWKFLHLCLQERQSRNQKKEAI